MSDHDVSTAANSGTGPLQTRSARIHEIVSSQKNFDKFITSPLGQEGLQSPDISTNNKDFVSPDELFGPVSPSRNDGRESIHAIAKKNDTWIRNRGTPKDEMNNKNEIRKSKQHPRDYTMHSPSRDKEQPLWSHSKFESVARNDVNSTNSTHTNNGNTHNHASPERYSDTNNTDRKSNLKTLSMSVTKNNVTNARAKLYPSNGSQNGFSTSSSYNHTHILDDNLNISDSKLDTTLLKLFSTDSSVKGNFSYDKHQVPQLSYSQSDFIGLEPVMWRVHPMTAAHKETLDREMDFIAFHVQPRKIISHLYKDGILTPMDYNQLTRTEGQGDKAVTRLMIRTLQRRGSKAYPALINALLASDYFFVCERLSHSEHDLYNGIITDRNARREGIQATPYGTHTPYRRLTPGYVNDTSPFLFDNLFSSNQNKTWPSPNQIRLTDHMSPLYHSMPTKISITPDDVVVQDLHILQPSRLEQRLDDLDAGFKLIRQEIASLKTYDARVSPRDHASPRHHVPIEDTTLEAKEDVLIDPRYLEHQLTDLKDRLDELKDHVAALPTAKSDVSKTEKGPIKISRQVTKESISLNSRSRSVRQATPPTYQVTNQKNVDVQIRELEEKLKDLRRDIMALTTSTSQNFHPEERDSMHGSYGDLNDQTDDILHKRLYTEKLDEHLNALRVQIRMLHDDVTALKMARSVGTTSHSDSPSRSVRDHIDYPITVSSRSKQQSPLAIEREKSEVSYSNVILGPIPQPSFTRYPSRYSPRGPENGRSVSRSEKTTKGLGDKQKGRGSKSNSRNAENKNKTSRKNMTINGYMEDDDWMCSKDDDAYPQEKEGLNRNKDGTSIKADNSYTGSNESFAKSVLTFESNKAHLNNSGGSSRVRNNGRSKNRNDDSFDTWEEDNDVHYKHGRYYSNEHPDKHSTPRATRDRSNQNEGDGLKNSKLASTTSDDKRRHKERSLPIPIIITSDEKFSEEPDSSSRTKNSMTSHYDAPPPREKKKVRYDTNTPVSDIERTHRFNQERPKSRAAHPAHRRVGNTNGDTHRIPSPTNSITSEGSDYFRVTTPTRILSPTNDAPFERVTTPYKILRNPYSRKITTQLQRRHERNPTSVTSPMNVHFKDG